MPIFIALLDRRNWPNSAGKRLPKARWCSSNGPSAPATLLAADRLDIAFHLDCRKKAPLSGTLTLTGYGRMAQRLSLAKAIHGLLHSSGSAGADRAFMQGDASTRAYESLVNSGPAPAILMISPPRPDGPPIRAGKPYSAIARLAENIRPSSRSIAA